MEEKFWGSLIHATWLKLMPWLREEFFLDRPDMFRKVRRFWVDNGVLPSRELIEKWWGGLLSEPEDPATHFAEEMRKRYVHGKLMEIGKVGSALVKKGEVDEAAKAMFDLLIEAQVGKGSIVRLSDIDILSDYEMAKKYGLLGVSSGIKEIDDVILGFRDGTLSIIWGITGCGKSFEILRMAAVNTMAHLKVLFWSGEDLKEEVAQRMYALMSGLPFDRLVRGKLDKEQEKELYALSKKVRTEWPNFILMEPFGLEADTLGGIEGAVARYQPNVLFVDGLYLIEGTGGSHWEKVKAVATGLKTMAMKYKVPIIATTQAIDAESEGSLYGAAYSKEIPRIADLVIELYQSHRMRDDREVRYTILKGRNRPKASWMKAMDVSKMDFGIKYRIRSDVEPEKDEVPDDDF